MFGQLRLVQADPFGNFEVYISIQEGVGMMAVT